MQLRRGGRRTPKIFARKLPFFQRSIVWMDIKHQKSKINNRVGVIDVIAQDSNTGEVVLVMNEPEPWDDSDERLLALQERFNAYVSFLLDGEMASEHPELAGKPARIELRCVHIPDTRALELLGMIHDQLAFQEIRMEVVVAETQP
ncbi:MAG TPA: DUF6572 domain-containing protein [Candidatus Baltobacteraceae bacterium]|nr:DUF6572 domain-containing protein [Candidatus Baltobacteraceae bacterium]